METLEISGASALISCADDEDRNPVSDVHKAIAIFDASIENYHDLIAGLHPHIVPYILPPHEDGIRTLTQILQRHNHPLSVYLVTHGAPGSLQLGNTELNLTTLRRYAEALGTWFQPNSELFLYACNVAAGDAGEELLSKLHQLTGASIAASARRVGNGQQGGTWALDVVAGEMAIALPFSAATVASYPGTFPLAISGIDAAYDDVPDNTITYTADEVADIDGSTTLEEYTYNFPVGTQNNLIISGFEANGGADSFGFVQLVDQVRVERIDNAEVTGTREIFWYEREAIDTTGNVLDLRPSDVFSLEEALLSQTINRGADNVFANQGDINLNNIERVDFVERGGIAAPATALDDIGFLLLERGGNDPITIAPITAVDVNGTPTAYGTLTTFAETEWGGSGINIETAVLNDLGAGNNQPGVSALPGAQEISGIFVSFTDLGIGANQQFFGYSVFPGDVGTDLVGLSDANTSTSSATGQGGLDLVAGGALFLRSGANIPPVLDLDPSNTTGGANNGNFQATFASGGVDITAPNATGFDPDNVGADIETLTITVDVFNGANEILDIGGTSLPLTNGSTATPVFGSTTFDVAVAVAGGTATVTVTNSATGDIPNVDIQQFLRSLTYDNTSANPDTTDRVFSFIAEDGQANSNTVTSTVTFATTTNTPPVLNLDPDNVTGGVNNRNFEATFNAGGGAVDITADAATAVDPDNSGVDIETLSIAVNVPDGANEILSFGGTSLALTNGAATTVTLGSTTFEIAVAVNGGNATVSIDSASGGDIPNTALRRLLRSLTYDNTSASPDQTDRVFTFIANDGLANSNTVTSTISVEGGTTPPPTRDCSGGLRLAGNATNNRLVGSARTDIIRGFAGNDEMLGLACPDRLLGGAGNDRLFGGGASDTLDGGAGRDRLSGQNGADILFGRGGTDRLNGGKGNDQLSGQAGLDYLRGKAGADRLRGGQGGDGMAGGAGRDRMFGGGGNDRMFGGSGRDRMRGNARADRMFGGGGNDRMFGQNGRDLLRGEAGRDILQGGAGNDRMLGGADNDRLFGGARNDVLSGGQGADRLLGQRGDDQLRGGAQNDRLSGGSGNDRAAGGTGNDQILGGSGSDTLRGNLGADRLFGGTGRDQLFGGRGNDRIDGGSQNDVLRGNLGADVLFGRGGFDTLRGGQGFDRLNGGGGKDRVFGGRGNDRIDGGSQNDTLRGNVGADLVLGKAGNDVIQGDRGFDRLNGGGGNDTINGGGAADSLFGKAGRDRLEGLAGNDQLFGNNGRDTLVGGSGNDLLVGKAEGDTLQGDRGADRFAFSGATVAEALRDSLVGDTDRILDFDQTEGDRFDINVTGGATAIPSALFNVGQVAGPNLQAAATRAFRDRNPNRAGNQRLGAQQAVFFYWRGQSYLLVNNSNRSFNALQDLVVNVTGIELGAGDANRVSLAVNDYFA